MKIKAIYIILSLFIVLGACTKDFEELDSPKTTSDLTDPGTLFTRSLVTGSGLSYSVWQYMHQIGGSSWAQHWANINYEFRWDNYEPTPGNRKWDHFYARAHFAPLNFNHHVRLIARELENPIMEAQSHIWDVYMYQFLTDTYGDIPYTEAFLEQRPAFDSQEYIYTDMLQRLEDAIETIEENRGLGLPGFGQADVLYQGDLDRWITFANSMILRIAMRASNVAAVDLTEHYLSSLDIDNTITENQEMALMYPDPGGPTDHVKNPINYVHGWNEVRLSKTMFDILQENNDPRLEVFASPNAHGEYAGLQNGQHPDSLETMYTTVYRPDYSNIGEFFTREDTPIYLFTSAETYFLKAEAAQRGFISGNAQEYYEEGIRASMHQFGLSEQQVSEYLQGPAAFDEANALEQIYTQKWIALYPNGAEAWAEVRRTGYPEMQPLAYYWPGNEEIPRRKPYPINERRYNSENYQQAVDRMGGDDQYTRVWWDGGN